MAKRNTSGLAPVIESPVERPVRSKERRACACGRQTLQTWYPGCDQAHKGRLLKRFDEGNTEAGDELIRRGWKTEEALADREAKRIALAEARAEKAQAREAARAVKAEAPAELEARIANRTTTTGSFHGPVSDTPRVTDRPKARTIRVRQAEATAQGAGGGPGGNVRSLTRKESRHA